MARNGLDGLVLHPQYFEKSPTPTLISLVTKPALLPPAVNKDVSLPHPLFFDIDHSHGDEKESQSSFVFPLWLKMSFENLFVESVYPVH